MRAKEISIRDGVEKVVAGAVYKGRDPVYQPVYDRNGVITAFVKVTKGLPYVRITPRRHEAAEE